MLVPSTPPMCDLAAICLVSDVASQQCKVCGQHLGRGVIDGAVPTSDRDNSLPAIRCEDARVIRQMHERRLVDGHRFARGRDAEQGEVALVPRDRGR